MKCSIGSDKIVLREFPRGSVMHRNLSTCFEYEQGSRSKVVSLKPRNYMRLCITSCDIGHFHNRTAEIARVAYLIRQRIDELFDEPSVILIPACAGSEYASFFSIIGYMNFL